MNYSSVASYTGTILEILGILILIPVFMSWIFGDGMHTGFFIGAVLSFILGMFLDPNAILMILGPLLMPVVGDVGLNPLAYSVMVALSVEIGVLTPPYGLVLFVSVGILKEDFGFITRSVLMFYPALIVGQFLIIYVPQISTFLPNTVK